MDGANEIMGALGGYAGARMGEDGFGAYLDLVVVGVVQRFRWCPPGVFWMGSPDAEVGRWDWEGPVHAVTLSRGFWMADTPVTQAFYLAVMGENPSHFLDHHAGLDGGERPVESVSWHDGETFCRRLNVVVGVAGHAVFRLPTEAEWEYACRAGGTPIDLPETAVKGFMPDELAKVAWYAANSGEEGEAAGLGSAGSAEGGSTRPVKQKGPNRWGLWDMLGNVDEWCADAIDGLTGYERVDRTDPVGRMGSDRVVRGGSYSSNPRGVRPGFRFAVPPEHRWRSIGFRLVWG